MRHWKLSFLFIFVLAIFCGSLAEAQLSGEYADWADGPDGFLLTKKEHKAWKKIKSDSAAEQFVELFWAKRNPDATSSFNPFKAEYEQRIRVADENFGYKNHRGALTDRAKVFLLLGPPANIQRGGVAQDPRGTNAAPNVGGLDADTGSAEYWVYSPKSLPEGFDYSGNQIVFIFQESRLGSADFNLDRSKRENMTGMQLLHQAPEVYLRHPELKEVPKPISIAGAKPAQPAHLAWLAGDSAPFNDSATVLVEEGVQDETSRPLWVHLELPSEAPTLDLLVGDVKTEDGEVQSTFEIEPKPLAGQTGTAYQLGFSLAPGTYTLEIAGATGGTPQVTETINAELEPIPDQGAWMSPVWIGVSAQMEPQAPLGTPFDFGGWRVIPVTSSAFTKENELVYFGFLVRPGLDEAGKPKLEAQLRVLRDGTQLGRPLTVPLEASQIVGQLFMYGNSVALQGLPEAGKYEIVFKVTDEIADISEERSVPIDLAE